MKELVQFLAQQLVNNPDAVEVKETQSDTASILELRVAKEDLGPGNRQAGPHGEIDPHDSQRGRFADQSQGCARNYRREIGPRWRANEPGTVWRHCQVFKVTAPSQAETRKRFSAKQTHFARPRAIADLE